MQGPLHTSGVLAITYKPLELSYSIYLANPTTVKIWTSPVYQAPFLIRWGFLAGECIMSRPELWLYLPSGSQAQPQPRTRRNPGARLPWVCLTSRQSSFSTLWKWQKKVINSHFKSRWSPTCHGRSSLNLVVITALLNMSSSEPNLRVTSMDFELPRLYQIQ